MKRLIPALFAVLAFAGQVMACPMCKDSIPNSNAPNADGVPMAFNISCYLFLGGLIGTLGLISFGMFRAVQTTNSRPCERRGFPVEPTKKDL